ncbi:MAG: 50S ribosomal protein L25/general stress protein Ctc [Lysobacterales bacterium]
MATIHEITVSRRGDAGKGASRRLRRTGKVPAIVYGGDLAPVSIELEHKDVLAASQNEWFYSSILDLNLDGDRQKALLRDIQRHPFRQIVLHLDFQRVRDDVAIRVRVPLHFLNQEKSPAGKTSGVIIMREVTEVEVSCLPKDLPEYIDVDLGNVSLGDIIHLSDVKLPAGVEIPALKLGREYDHAVVVVKEIREEVEAAPVAEEGAAEAAAPGATPAGAPGAAPAAAPAAGAGPAAAAPKKDEKK